eukprot:TRINITY_DN17145_c0_g1_i1.p1 TRINITY_DN17145_c0_g1~~TRINITY_DN17145_c0_g1_i1.p1  ORF type:complete len:283 (-),score=29.63 TRINITY_DN17145_c0_g1_i1:188-1036(-)
MVRGGHFLALLSLLVLLLVNRQRSSFVTWRSCPARVLRTNQVVRFVKKKGGPLKTHMPLMHPFVTKASHLYRHNINQEPLTMNVTFYGAAKDLKSENVTVRRAAIDILYHRLRRANSTVIMEALLEATYDEDLKVRMDAANMLKRLSISDRYNCDQFLCRLAARLGPKSDADSFERVLTLETLSRVGKGAKNYCQYMADQLGHEDWLVRLSAVNALAETGEVNYHKFFRAAVIRREKSDENLEVRKAASDALRRLKPLKPRWMIEETPGWILRVRKKSSRRR